MFKFLITATLLLVSINSFSQKVTLQKDKPEKNIPITTNNYTVYVDFNDIEQTLHTTTNKQVIRMVKNDSVKLKIDLDAKGRCSEGGITDILTEHTLAYLLSNGKAYIENADKKTVPSLMMEKSPEMKGLDGKTIIQIIFSDKNTVVYQGQMYTH